jgi:hypothetical protein
MLSPGSRDRGEAEVRAMGEVISFTATGSPSRLPRDRGEEAQILLFTGVRYLRIDFVEPEETGRPTPRTPPNRRGSKRRA